MIIRYKNSFDQSFRELSRDEQKMVIQTIDLFQEDPFHPALQNHELHRELIGQRAISVSDDIRIIFREKWHYTEILMLDVGDHKRVYGI